ncbi:HBL292Cp [Eremothecium sinecaudum]|uniref:HBL292Cp n=1 Tax=Eremothecium sinecaudum TaxID=45286 RepID=A0A125RDU4_9SACH|nr:HBL292Cp [Eremothecium sinecaudum]AMD18610.1 HBL292Cp [Eremothecium sinecaudum]
MSQQDQFIADDVTANRSNVTRQMLVKEYKKIGHGAFGTVVQAYLTPDNEKWYGPFAIKKVPAQTEYKSRELAILRIADHPNVVKLEYFFTHFSPADGKLYQHLAMECLPETLQHEILRYTQDKLDLPLKHVKLYTYQIARGMLYLHALGICHRDIKPSNILVDPKTAILKICDFGSAKKLEQNQPSISYICSRFYRAPELIVGCTQYTTQIDIWGLGCVIGEMLIGKAVFQGQEPLLQLHEIAKLLGPPDKKFIFFSNPSYGGPLFSKPLFSGTPNQRFEKYFGHAGPDGIDLLMKVLCYSPERRLSPRRIMSHPFLDDLRRERYFFPGGSSQPKQVPDLFDFSEFELEIIGELLPQIMGKD